MTIPRLVPSDDSKPSKLPEFDDRVIPAWSITRRIVGVTAACFCALAIAAVVTLSVVSIRVTVDADGIVEPQQIYPVRALESGTIDRILVKTGTRVRKGEILARTDTLDAAALVADLRGQMAMDRLDGQKLAESAIVDSARAAAQVAGAEARVAQARTGLRQVMANFMITGDADSIAAASTRRVHVALDAPSAALRAAVAEAEETRVAQASTRLTMRDLERKRADMDRLRQSLAVAESRLARHTILSPADGVVLTDQLEQLLGASVVPGQQVIEIADVARWNAILFVKEADVYRIRPGDRAEVEIPAFASQQINHSSGHVDFVGWQPGAPTADVAMFRVVVALDSADVRRLSEGTLRRGYVARAKIVTRAARVASLLIESIRNRSRALIR